MALSIKDEATDRLVRELVTITGESLAEAVRRSVDERLLRERRKHGRERSLVEELDALALECAALPDLDTRSREEIVGYDEHGAPR